MTLFDIPLPASQRKSSISDYKCCKYFKRIFKFDQMDFQCALWQITYLFIAPQKLTKLFRARKQLKSQYARDDPAFLVLFAFSMAITSFAFAIVLKLNFVQFIKFVLFLLFIDSIGVGMLVATVLWYFSNRVLNSNSANEDVEWGFAFDVHLNAYYPPFILSHFVQLLFFNSLINHEWFLSILLGNTFWLMSAIYYIYITFIAYSSLKIFTRTRLILTPIPWLCLLYVITLIVRVNISHEILNLYRYRVK